MSEAPERLLVFDCFSGVAGDMALAALVDAGADLTEIRSRLGTLNLPPVALSVERVRRGGLDAVHVTVEPSSEQHYNPGEMSAIIGDGDLPDRVRSRSLAAIEVLAEAESAVHGEGATFHEVGGVDAVVDIVGTMVALELLSIDACFCPVVTVGAGTIARTAHGVIAAAPGPAAEAILETARFPLRFVESSHELVTPTGAAILAASAVPGPAVIVPELHGTGAGSRDTADRPNALRVFAGRTVAAAAPQPSAPLAGTSPISLLEANIDDMTAALLAHVRDRLLEEGALDAWTEAIGMKKGRSATKLCALCRRGEEERLSRIVLAETTTLGIRVAPYQRFELPRSGEVVTTSFGPVRVKVAVRAGRREAVPEYDDVVAIAAARGIPARDVQSRLQRELGEQDRT